MNGLNRAYWRSGRIRSADGSARARHSFVHVSPPGVACRHCGRPSRHNSPRASQSGRRSGQDRVAPVPTMLSQAVATGASFLPARPAPRARPGPPSSAAHRSDYRIARIIVSSHRAVLAPSQARSHPVRLARPAPPPTAPACRGAACSRRLSGRQPGSHSQHVLLEVVLGKTMFVPSLSWQMFGF